MRFEKVPFEEFRRHFVEGDDGFNFALEAYEHIKLPQRSTPGSAGYDFFLPMNVCLTNEGCNKFPTGIRAIIDPGWFLMCVPRSGLGFKYGVRLINTAGIIDEDFAHSDSYGHIMVGLTTEIPVSLQAGDRFMQGIFLKYGTTEDDCPLLNKRSGGIGSTGGVSV